MGCPRCHNLMVEETFVDRETSPSVSSFTGWRCLICGEILDSIILEHRRVQREPMTGRACVLLKARFMSAHKSKGSERDGDVRTILLTEQLFAYSDRAYRPGPRNFFRV